MKRFSDTSRFEEEWYVDLPIEFKIAWEYVWAKCDNAGVWNPSLKLADFAIGKKIKWEEFIAATGGRILILPNKRWQVVGFVELQCGLRFSAESRPHQSIMALLGTHGIDISDSLSIVYARGTGTPKDKDKEEEGDFGVDKGSGEKEGPSIIQPPAQKPKPAEFVKPERADFDAYVLADLGMTQNDADHAWNSYENNGWTRAQAGKRISIANWKLALNTWKTGLYFPSQKAAPRTNGSHAPARAPMPQEGEHF